MNHSEQVPPFEDDFYYFVLNLNRAASQNEINERHRALSLIFHPDKQRDINSKEIATKKFLEIQKAYQVLSDPFLREVYDVLGERGVSIRWSPEVRSKSREEVRKLLAEVKSDMAYQDLDARISPSGTVTSTIDATSLFEPYVGSKGDSLSQEVFNRLEDVRLLSFGLKYSIKKRLNERTTVGLASRIDRQQRGRESVLMGTLSHQFSPRLTAKADLGLLWPHVLRAGGTYDQNGSTVAVHASYALAAVGERTPSLKVSLSRHLFRRRFDKALLELELGARPHFGINLISPSVFGLQSLEQSEEPLRNSVPPSTSGLEVGTTHRKLGISFDSIIPTLVAEWSVNFVELALQLKLGVQYGLLGFSWVCAGTWSNSDMAITAASILNPTGVSLRLDFEHLQQQFSLPILISLEPQLELALWTVFLPSTALVVGYHFILKPRRRRRRLEHIRAARKAIADDSVYYREREAVTNLLRDSARKSKAVEESKEGLVITEATYGSHVNEDRAPDLVIDVTISLQALVRNSQLYVSAEHPRSGIQGFSDPAPFTHKMLSIRYVFGGRLHYAEIFDQSPVVLPLAEHLVE